MEVLKIGYKVFFSNNYISGLTVLQLSLLTRVDDILWKVDDILSFARL